MSDSKEIKQDVRVNENIPMIIIPYAKTIDQAEKDCLRSVIGFNLIHKVDSKSKTQKLEDMLKTYSCILVDMRKNDIREWYYQQRKYIDDNSDSVLCVYVAKSGKHLTADDITQFKKNLKCKYVRKNLTKDAKTYKDLISFISSDHVQKGLITLSVIEKIINLVKSCIH